MSFSLTFDEFRGNLKRLRATLNKQNASWLNSSSVALLSAAYSIIEEVPLDAQEAFFYESNQGYHDK